jgi:hypothetical protein
MIYRDSNGVQYAVGDIVNNPFFGDYWVVQEVTEQDKEMYGLSTEICLALYNSKDDYVIDIDEPVGFVIVMTKEDEKYDEMIQELNAIAKEREAL